MARIIGRSIDENIHAARVVQDAGDYGLGCLNLGQVNLIEGHLFTERHRKRFARVFIDIHEGQARSLICKCRDNMRTDPRRTCGDNDVLSCQSGG